MKELQLTQGYVALVDDEDYERASQYKWFAQINRKTVYAQRSTPRVEGKQGVQLLHRFLLNLPGGHNPEVDHKDRNGLNCQKYNLRTATRQQNCCNRNDKVKQKGISWSKSRGKWKAHIQVDKKELHLGYFALKETAAATYDAAALKHYKEFALTNEMLSQQKREQDVE